MGNCCVKFSYTAFYKNKQEPYSNLPGNFFDLEADDIHFNKIIHEQYQAQGLRVMVFPCNQFFNQEKQAEPQILENLLKKYGLTFQLMAKVEVNGPDAHPVFVWLRANTPQLSKKKTQGLLQQVPWNFSKFLVNQKGEVVGYWRPAYYPREVLPAIKRELEVPKISKAVQITNNYSEGDYFKEDEDDQGYRKCSL